MIPKSAQVLILKSSSQIWAQCLWAYDNELTFHKDECCYLHFQKTKSCYLVLGHQTLQEESRAVDIGVAISNDLSWNAHILTKLVNATKSLFFCDSSNRVLFPSSYTVVLHGPQIFVLARKWNLWTTKVWSGASAIIHTAFFSRHQQQCPLSIRK